MKTLFDGYMKSAYAACSVAVAPVRSEPAHKAEQTTQLLFGEKVQVLDVNKSDWAQIRCEWDGYEGWCRYHQLMTVTNKEYLKEAKYMVPAGGARLLFADNAMWLPAGGVLTNYRKGGIQIQAMQGRYKGKKQKCADVQPTCATLINAARAYLHAPYQWGGRSIAGIDCSGLSQMAYRFCNVRLQRDTTQQALQGNVVDFLQNAICGDLAFFENPEGKIVHVGILIDNKTIIHATDTVGRVVIDHIDQGGIISGTLRKRTHRLRVVKRII
jgi:gamma-D-glutamyl-L-lysine dipeptidyl-peptidase